MIAVSSAPQNIANSGVLAWTLAFPLPGIVKTGRAEFVFPSFDYSFNASFDLDFSPNSTRNSLRVKLDENVMLECDFREKKTNGSQKICYEGKAQLKIASDKPSAHFIANTLELLLLLDSNARLNITGLQLSIDINPAESLAAVSTHLQRRQTAYRLMVIEKAFNQSFSIPHLLSDFDRKDIAFAYYAVVDRFFAWPFGQETFPFPATAEAKRWLESLDGKKPAEITAEDYQFPLLGERLAFGKTLTNIESALIANTDEVSRELQTPDGHQFQASIKSLAGRATYQFFEAPRFENNDFDKRVTELINLEEKLDEKFFEAGNNLVASTLADLTDEEKAAITEPFTLDEEAFRDPILLGEED